MKLSVLVDNNTIIDQYYFGEPGLSYYIQYGNVNILFDTGYSDIFLKNAEKMNIDLNNLDFIILSHGHDDHTLGIKYLINYYEDLYKKEINYKKPMIIAHPLVFNEKYYIDKKNKKEQIGISIELKKKIYELFDVKLTKDPLKINNNLYFLGEIKRNNDFENKKPIGKTIIDDNETDDFLIDDTALVYKATEGIVIITGCSHSGICNIIDYATKIFNDNRIIDIIGGFHLLKPSEKQLKNTLEYFSKLDVKNVHACHCTDLISKIKLSNVVNIKEVGVGLELEFS